MNKIKRWLAALLAAIMLLGATASLAEGAGEAAPVAELTLEELQALNGGAARVYTHDNRVTFVDGACTDGAVLNMDDAARVVQSMIELLGGDDRTKFEPWRTLTDTAGNRYYVFQQMYAGVTVSGGAVKVVTDRDGAMLGLVSSVESELPEVGSSRGITAREAEALVVQHALDAEQEAPEILENHTAKVVLPVNLELDMEADEEKEESRFVWVVYTYNPSVSVSNGSDLPYLAHYVDLSGEYLYSLPTVIPGDEVSTSGYKAAYVFEFMEPVDYTGTVTLSDGTQKEITVQVMRDSRTGMYYLGNVKRRIAVADCYEMLFNRGHVVLEASKDNTGWDDTCLLSLYNYCRAWDYYNAIGWKGGDGLQTPMLILKDYCDKDHNSIDNAAYAGHYYGWQIFLSSAANDYSQCIDVLAHEFTHCVTGSVMTYNAYMNDYGAINEAMSDIQGNICDFMYKEGADPTVEEWLLGEDGKAIVRNMSDPHDYGQPEYAWDLFYTPKVKSPTDLNDRGGVHTNSSLLNYLAWQLCAKGGLSLEDARAYWFAVDCSMVPGTDYAQLSELLPWVLRNLGLEDYMDALEAAIDKTRIRTDEMPETFDDDRALVTLTLPESEQFADGNWALEIVSVNLDGMLQRAIDILDGAPGYEAALDELARVIAPDGSVAREDIPQLIVETVVGWMDETEPLEGETPEPPAEADDGAVEAMFNGLSEWVGKYFEGMIYAGMGAAGQDGRTVRMVCRPGLTVPILFRMEFKPNSMQLKSAGLAVYVGRWIDLGGVLRDLATMDDLSEAPEDDGNDSDFLESLFGSILEMIAAGEGAEEAEPEPGAEITFTLQDVRDILVSTQQTLKNLAWLRNMFLYEIRPGQVNAIPADGLEQTTILGEEIVGDLMTDFSSPAEQEDAGQGTAEEELAPAA